MTILPLVAWSWIAFQAQPQPVTSLHVELRHGSCAGAKGAISYEAAIARTDPEKERGLGFRTKKLGKHEAMIFVYETPGPRTYWMKETHIPLSIFYFDAAGKLLSSSEMPVEPDPGNPAKTYPEKGAVGAVLEVAPGATKRATAAKLDHLCIPAAAN